MIMMTWPRLQFAGIGDDDDNVVDDDDNGDDNGEGDHDNDDVTQIAICRHWSEEWEQNPPVRGQQILQVSSSL